MKPARDIERLIEIMAALRTPGTGCPWDLEQDFASIAPYTIEEAHEVADAIARGDLVDLKDELGDLLLQVVFHAQMAQEQGSFAFPDVVEAITTKLIRRHPHVFGDVRDLSPAEVKALWGQIKAQEKADKARARAEAGLPEPPEAKGVLAGVPTTLPALTRAWKLQAKASTVGFDWNNARLVLDKVREETAEIEEALAGGDKAAIQEEIGDLLFVVANLARHVDADPEACLTAANAKFERRFAGIEAALERQGREPRQATLEELEELWQQVKRTERATP
ncbi:nucleoside triphosphate pyrophosphohydrolase [Bosea sp. 62]|uniref:nucleoside triphosphate pyrophosphohydrolase n=1 Tax=unclassified Bosea (in: a-proteobacteria) TaxID=2653178 RepID=UPI0012527B60|nr:MULTISPECIES: nucleoside triphosphate pyrophosphohydrolase [unclassified Bosea (in: a-proteobacteria)]CAD5259296.1 nucleoside triphosphate pyrophosphohydrolase [Bosea sp. 46]CAD5263717.1 nucleoside triphosphate pyrophosphohydrolase [Bosea sp. 21B]CAD5276560.1 nucleoside triphosphate pyrophosphohydrolase [Bosea sp. 7B]VVT59026.1 nucleoside triphosphate pyrophosphohydrolase [Bosea sp. EC-HK365B]VXB66146.1 nucleoside triphosphate pyrophosphohydrolase [Bosea sp. 29B]